jgi:hypothetical protein
MVLKCHQGKSRLPELTEKEPERVEEALRTQTAVKTRLERFGVTVGEKVDGDRFTKFAILTIDQSTAYVQLTPIDDLRPIVDKLDLAVKLGDQVHVRQEVAELIDLNRGHTTPLGFHLDGELFREQRKIGRSLESRVEIRGVGFARDMFICFTTGYKLRQGST